MNITLGGTVLDGKQLPEACVNLALKSFSRHGLIAGATGTGKTKTTQAICEQLSLNGVPSLVMDIKGDMSGLAKPGALNDAFIKRNQSLGLSFTPRQFSVELLSLSQGIPGLPLRATVFDFGPILFARLLDVNETQSGVITVLFEYAKENHLPLIDLNDVKSLLKFMQSPKGKTIITHQYGTIASTSIGTIMRKLIELESQGAETFFGEPAFDINDLVRFDSQGHGVISVLRLMDMQDSPKLFSTFMLKLLSDVFRQFPEVGDLEKPKLVIFIDEAHLIFYQASKSLLNLIETTVKLIRSKGVGIIFSTQLPTDIPQSVLSQLGLKIQHALRAFTAKDRQSMKLIAQNFPPSTDYNIELLLTNLPVGEALVSSLDEKGQPTALVQCYMRAPESRMGTLSDSEVQEALNKSPIYLRYAVSVNKHSASEILESKQSANSTAEAAYEKNQNKNNAEPSIIEKLSKNTLVRQLIRDLFRSVLKLFSSNQRK